MSKNTNISVIQLIKDGEISIDLEIEKIHANKDVNVNVRKFLGRSSDYQAIKKRIEEAEAEREKSQGEELIFLEKKVHDLKVAEKDYITNALLLAKAFSEIEVPTERLRKAMELFEKGQIKQADELLVIADLLDDQFNLLVLIEYKEAKLKLLENGQ
ncbi:MAG: hypothetical protein AB3N14_02985 [Flavobacteriaceae bacterium]